MNYLQDFLLNRTYKSLMIMFGFMFICFTDIYKNEFINYNYLSNSTDFDNITLKYNDTNIETCCNISKSIHFYKINNIFTNGLLLLFLSIINFELTNTRKSFCYLTLSIFIINFIWSSFIEVVQFYFNCLKLMIDYIPQAQILFYINYIITLAILASFILPINYKLKRRINYINMNSELPKYDDIINESPPTYTP